MRSGRVKKSTRPSPRLPKQEILRDIEYSMRIGNLVWGVNSVTVSYLIRCDRLLQNATDTIRKCDRSLLQNASNFLLQNATVLLQI